MATKNNPSISDLINRAEEEAREMSSSLRTNQVRNFYSGVLRIKQKYDVKKEWTNEIEKEILRLKPALAYAAGRQNAVKAFKDFLDPHIDDLLNAPGEKKAQLLENFFTLIESFIAYHKFYGGKD